MVPRDFSVIGFDGLMNWVPGGGNLTSAVQNFERIGQTAVRLLKDRIAHGVADAGEVVGAGRVGA